MFVVQSAVGTLEKLSEMAAPPVTVVPLPQGIATDLHIAIPLRDGARLRANVYRPVSALASVQPASDTPPQTHRSAVVAGAVVAVGAVGAAANSAAGAVQDAVQGLVASTATAASSAVNSAVTATKDALSFVSYVATKSRSRTASATTSASSLSQAASESALPTAAPAPAEAPVQASVEAPPADLDPAAPKPTFPVVLCIHPYGKDNLPALRLGIKSIPIQYRLIRQSSPVSISTGTTWESPDPAHWVPNGYVLVNVDLRGFGTSDAAHSPADPVKAFSDEEAQDVYDAIEWAAAQPWSNGNVGLAGVSYLAAVQYKVAALAPPHLKAICPWEGFSDLYRDFARPGGIRADGFIEIWSSDTCKDPKNSLRSEQLARTKRDDWYKASCANLGSIRVPTLVCMSFSDQGLNTAGSFRVFRDIASEHKWMYTHRGGKWAEFYGTDAREVQTRFFGQFLKGTDTGMLSMPRVRLEVRSSQTTIENVSWQNDFPLPNTDWQTLHLNLRNSKLETAPLPVETETIISSQTGSLRLYHAFERDTTLAGPMKLQVWVSSPNCSDIHLFAGVRKFVNGVEIPFEGMLGWPHDLVTRGMHRVAFRDVLTTHPSTGRPLEPWEVEYAYETETPLVPGDRVCVQIQLLPSATVFPSGSRLELHIQGHWFFERNALNSLMNLVGYDRSPVAGEVHFHSGGPAHDSFLLVPIVHIEQPAS